MNYLDTYRQCIQIRLFEKRVEKEFGLGHMRGTTHGCIGQEIIPVLVMNEIDRAKDYITGTHRCHGQVLSYSKNPYKLACEMMGRKDGFVNGLGGSQHIKTDKYITNGITGGMVSVGAGIAMGIRKKKDAGIVISFLGDGGFNEGYVQESLNLSSHFELPILFICENNGYAMSTPTTLFSAGDYRERVNSLNIEYNRTNTANPIKLEEDIVKAFVFVRNNKKPYFIDIHTARLCGHSKSDPMDYMSEEEKNKNISEDPLLWLEKRLSSDDIHEVTNRVICELDDVFERAGKCEEYISAIYS